MAILSEVNALVDLTLKAVTLQQQIRDGWYKSSQEMANFETIVDDLKQRKDEWLSLLQRCGIPADHQVWKVVGNASRLLEENEKQLKKLQDSCCLRIFKQAFPGKLTVATDSVMKAFEKIPEFMVEGQRRTKEVEHATRQAALRQQDPLPFSADAKYVPLKETVEDVRRALESESTRRVVVLYGGPGEGKSSTARYLALQYEQGIVPGPDLQQHFADGVFFLSCKPEADCQSLLVQLAWYLGFSDLCSIVDMDNENQDDEQPKSIGQISSEAQLLKLLSYRLENKKILVILDDVRDISRIEKFFLKGKGVKYLVTAQQEFTLLDQDSWPIRIRRPTLEDARKIMASHVGFEGEVPSHLMGEVDAIIDKLDKIPLVIANVAMSISKHRHSELGEWTLAEEHLDELQYGDDHQPAYIYQRSYSKRTMNYSMEMAMAFFPLEVHTLLYMVGIFEFSQPVPEVVLKLFCKTMKVSLARFSKCCEYLENTSFIQIQIEASDWSNEYEDAPRRAW